jgi:uncharacterized protein YcbX
MHLASIHVYPIKSCAGFSPAEWKLDELGLEHDRRWMVIGPEGRPYTQRELPAMALIRPALRGPHLAVSAPGMPELVLPLAPMGGSEVEVRIWDWQGAGWRPSPEADQWFARYLGVEARAVYCPPERGQAVSPKWDPEGGRAAFSDGYPLLLIGQASLDELNRRAPVHLAMNRFRPNLVAGGAEPFAEDDWRRIRIGAIPMAVVKGCDRCVLTTTDQETGERGVEPLRTLATFRKRDGKVWFGQNVVHRGTGVLRVGEAVVVEQAARAASTPARP